MQTFKLPRSVQEWLAESWLAPGEPYEIVELDFKFEGGAPPVADAGATVDYNALVDRMPPGELEALASRSHGFSRATFFRWRSDPKSVSKKYREAIEAAIVADVERRKTETS